MPCYIDIQMNRAFKNGAHCSGQGEGQAGGREFAGEMWRARGRRQSVPGAAESSCTAVKRYCGIGQRQNAAPCITSARVSLGPHYV